MVSYSFRVTRPSLSITALVHGYSNYNILIVPEQNQTAAINGNRDVQRFKMRSRISFQFVLHFAKIFEAVGLAYYVAFLPPSLRYPSHPRHSGRKVIICKAQEWGWTLSSHGFTLHNPLFNQFADSSFRCEGP